MSNSPNNSNQLLSRKWLAAYIVTAIGALLTQFHHIEPNAKRIAELSGLNKLLQLQPSPKVVTVEPPKKVETPPPSKPTVAPLRKSADMTDMLRALGGEKWEPHFNAHFRNRETALVLELTEVVDGRLKFQGGHTVENLKPTYYVTPRNRADLKKFKPGTRLLIEGDFDRYVDTGPGVPDEVSIVRARVSETKDPDPTITGSIKK
jgi:hypothetical protein